MSPFQPRRVAMPHHVEVAEDGHGHWLAKDTEGLVGGLFRTRRDALRFAMLEAEGDAACVCVLPGEPIARAAEYGR
jgi:hypothetical protein